MQSSLQCYQKHTTLGYSHRQQIQSHVEQFLSVQVRTKCSIRKIIRLVNNLLKMNLFQCALLCWLLRKSGSAIQQKLLQFSSQQLQQINAVNQQYQKRLLLILLLNGYHVKSNFLANGSQLDIDPLVIQTVKNFPQIYRQFRPQKSIKNISLSQINRIFQQWSQPKSSLNKNKLDYNRIVDKILFLSKTYNVGGGCNQQILSVRDGSTVVKERREKHKMEERENHKKRKINERIDQQQQPKPRFRYCEEKEIAFDNSPMKNSVSRMQWFEDQRPNSLNPLRRSTRTLNRSIFQMKQDRYDILPNESLFRSIKSQQSDNNMFGTLRNTNNRFFNVNSYVGINNQSILGNIFKSSLESDGENMKKSSKRGQSNGESKGAKLKPTTSYDDDMLK